MHYVEERADLEASAGELFDVVESGAVRIRARNRYPLREAAEVHPRNRGPGNDRLDRPLALRLTRISPAPGLASAAAARPARGARRGAGFRRCRCGPRLRGPSGHRLGARCGRRPGRRSLARSRRADPKPVHPDDSNCRNQEGVAASTGSDFLALPLKFAGFTGPPISYGRADRQNGSIRGSGTPRRRRHRHGQTGSVRRHPGLAARRHAP